MAILKSDAGEISYTLVRRKGMKNIRVKITDNGSVCVSAGAFVPVSEIERFLAAKSQWIVKNVQLAAEKEPDAPFTLSDGGKIQLFGRILTVRLQSGDDDIHENNGVLFIGSAEPQNAAHNERLLLAYTAEKGRAVMSEYYDFFFEKSGYVGVKPTLSLKILKSKWGHCNRRKNEIMMNFALCALDEKYSAYVAAHEVAHLLVPNHSPLFYRTGEALLPQFRQLDREMRGISTDLLKNMTVRKQDY